MPSLMVGCLASFSGSLRMIPISVGKRQRSFGTNVATDAGPTSSTGLAIFSPCKIAKP